DQLIRLSTGACSTPPSPAVRNHRIAVRLALEWVSALHRISHPILRSCPPLGRLCCKTWLFFAAGLDLSLGQIVVFSTVRV
ncbi:MAG: hypothetical protein WB760_29405, partial [Xanthobacteraceae bacterium]